jgi:hypothetical protein
MGKLRWVNTTMPTPKGAIEVNLKREGKTGIKGTVTLPKGVTGVFVWKGKKVELGGGVQKVVLE